MIQDQKLVRIYETMRDAIHYMRDHANNRPDVATVAKAVGMSRSRFEHVFTEWAGIPPKRFIAHLTKERAKEFLGTRDVLKAAYASGLSGPGRLHGLMITHEAVSPGEFKSGDIEIKYGIHPSPFGWCLVGLTARGVCHLSFLDKDDRRQGVAQIQQAWPKARLVHDPRETGMLVKKIFHPTRSDSKRPIHLLIKGTNFQVKVWEALLAIPDGQVASYAAIARAAGSSKAVRATGSSCGKNSIAYLIPCHRVLTSAGGIGGYRWGTERKETILAWESIQKENRGN
jgi:AraC family transcriptional regulator of adaptative response/methylated-DNA-[protein]-cysteine methyltransferase